MKQVLNSAEVAWFLQIPPGSVSRYARERGVRSLGTVRVGRSTVTRWAIEDVIKMAPAPPAGG